MADSKVRTILEVVDRTKPGITSAVKGLDRLARSSGALNRNILAMAGGRGIAGAVGGGAGGLGSLGSLGAAFATVTVRGIRFASTLESAALQLDFMTRKTRGFADGSKFAAQHLKTLTELARKSPLDLQELLQASTVLETFGAAALNNTKLLRGFVDAASALQQSMGPGGMLQISRQLGEILKVGAQGRGVGQALRVLETRGLGSAGIREAIAEINERGIQGTVEATEVMKQAIMGLFEGYEGAAEAASDTTSGLWQKAVETFDTMAAGLMRVTGLQEGWNNVMRFSIDLMESLTTVRPTAVNPGFSRHIGRTSAPGGRAGSGFAGLEMGFGAHTPAGTAATRRLRSRRCPEQAADRCSPAGRDTGAGAARSRPVRGGDHVPVAGGYDAGGAVPAPVAPVVRPPGSEGAGRTAGCAAQLGAHGRAPRPGDVGSRRAVRRWRDDGPELRPYHRARLADGPVVPRRHDAGAGDGRGGECHRGRDGAGVATRRAAAQRADHGWRTAS